MSHRKCSDSVKVEVQKNTTSRIFKYPDSISDQSHVSGKFFRTRATLDRSSDWPFCTGGSSSVPFESAPSVLSAKNRSSSSIPADPRHVAIEKNYIFNSQKWQCLKSSNTGNRFKLQPCFRKFCADSVNL